MKIKKMTLYQQVADNLNKKGYQPFSAREWKAHNVQSIVSRKLEDKVVWKEIEKVSKQMLNYQPTNK